VKELQSIVDYSRAPDAACPDARGPAIDPIFELSDPEPWCWTGTTHLENGYGYYVCFGRAFSAWTWNGAKMNAHGAGAVRSDPKTGDPAAYAEGQGPQGDEVRIRNHVLCVRGGRADLVLEGPDPGSERDAPGGEGEQPSGPGGVRGPPPGPGGEGFVRRLDRDGDGKVSPEEFDGPVHHFRRLDRDGDGFLTEDEAPRGPPPRRRR
jgi:hypothetical protein